jgi:hypothetical protein
MEAIGVIGLYKELPRKNCGECGVKTCMAFASAVVKEGADIKMCPYLAPEKADALVKTAGSRDWKLELIGNLTKDVAGLDLAQAAERLGGELIGDKSGGKKIRFLCIGRRYFLDAAADVTAEGPLSPWEKILILIYVKTGGSGPLDDRWVSFEVLRGGGVKVEQIVREVEEPLTGMFSRAEEAMVKAVARLGGRIVGGQPSDMAWVMPLLPKVPMLLLYWRADEEFPARVKVLFDRSADRFLDVETLMYVGEGFVKVLERLVR